MFIYLLRSLTTEALPENNESIFFQGNIMKVFFPVKIGILSFIRKAKYPCICIMLS